METSDPDNENNDQPDGMIPDHSLPSLSKDGDASAVEVEKSARGSNGRIWIAQYKLLQKIGEGGMGAVYMAEQFEPVRRKVALKLIKSGKESKNIISRFEAERQVLAMMNHPNIAQILDAGTAADGTPYFAMELINGIPLTEYCNRNQLSIRERLELFLPVCRAVQHAHTKGIIHRDLKPSNVLVAVHDGKPIPKVIDFGLAKALDPQTWLTDKTMYTEFGMVVGTLRYMSPEQAETNQLMVDARTDIYSLGVMLYELLTGSTPLDDRTMAKQALFQVLKLIREQDPPRPSDRLTESQETTSVISQQRQIQPAQLKQILRGELDWIVMKSLDKNRAQRYVTADAFAEDVFRFLNNDVVVARPPSLPYRVKKFVARNRGLVASLATMFFLLVAGIAGTSFYLFRSIKIAAAERQQRIRADTRTLEAERARQQARRESARATQKATEAKRASDAATRAQRKSERALARSNFYLADSRWRQNRTREAEEIIDQIPVQHRNLEWYLAKQRFAGSGLTCVGHRTAVTSVIFTADGQQMVSADDFGHLMVWNATTGQRTKQVHQPSSPQAHQRLVSAMEIAPTGKTLLTASWDQTVKRWNLPDLSYQDEIQHQSFVNGVAASPDGDLIATASNNRLRVWNADTAEVKVEIPRPQDAQNLSQVVFSPGGQRLAIRFSNRIQLYDLTTKRSIDFPAEAEGDDLCFSPDGRYLAAGGNNETVMIWKIDGKQEQLAYRLRGHTGGLECVRFSPNGTRLASGSRDGTIRVWDWRSERTYRVLRGHRDVVRCIRFNLDGSRLVSGSDDTMVKVWNLKTMGERWVARDFETSPACASLSPNGKRIASGSHLGSVGLWNPVSGQFLGTMEPQLGGLTGLAFSPDASLLLGSGSQGKVFIWDVTSRNLIQTFQAHEDFVNAAEFSGLGTRIVTAGRDQQVHIWDASTREKQLTISVTQDEGQDESQEVMSVRFSPDSSRIISGDYGGALHVHDASTGELIWSRQTHDHAILSIDCDCQSKLIATGGLGDSIKICELANGRLLQTLTHHSDSVYDVCFNADSSRLLSAGGDGSVKIFDWRTREELSNLDRPNKRVIGVKLDPEDQLLTVVDSDNSIAVYGLSREQEIKTLRRAADDLSAIAIHPDGTALLTGDEQGRLTLWDTQTRQPVWSHQRHPTHILQVAFDRQTSRVYSSDEDRSFVWDALTGESVDADWILGSQETRSTDGRWQIGKCGSGLLLSDNTFWQQSEERSFRAVQARFDDRWHRQCADEARQGQDAFAEMFHLACLVVAAKADSAERERLRSFFQNADQETKRMLSRSAMIAEALIQN